MSGDSVLRMYVYALVLAFVVWVLMVGWLATRTAWRLLRRHQSFGAVHPAEAGDRPHVHA